MNNEQTCCVTGHRDISAGKVVFIRNKLTNAVQNAIACGYTHFISGFAAGVDLMFAEIVADLKASHAITLEAAIPYPGRMKTPDKTFQRLIGACDVVKVHSAGYSKGCYMMRNRYMVDRSSLVIAVYDGRETGGTAATVRYAIKRGRTIKQISIEFCQVNLAMFLLIVGYEF